MSTVTTDLPERITAAVAEWRRWLSTETAFDLMAGDPLDLMLRACDHADKVLARHVPAGARVDYCQSGDGYWPCPEVRDLAVFWLGPGWENS